MTTTAITRTDAPRPRRDRETVLGFSLPLPRWREIERLSASRGYELLSTGEVDSAMGRHKALHNIIQLARFLAAPTGRPPTRSRSQGAERRTLCRDGSHLEGALCAKIWDIASKS